MSFRATLKIVLFFFMAWTPLVATAQQTGATVHGLVADPEQAVIPGATVTFTSAIGQAADDAVAERWNVCAARCSAGDVFGDGDDAGLRVVREAGREDCCGAEPGAGCADGDPGAEAGGQCNDVGGAGERRCRQQCQCDGAEGQGSGCALGRSGRTLVGVDARWRDLRRDRTAGRFMWMDLPAGSFLRSHRSARFASIRTHFRRSTTGWAMGALRCSPSRARTSFTGSSICRESPQRLNSGNPLLNAFNTPGQPEQTQPPYHTIFVLGNMTGPIAKNASFTVAGSHRVDSGQQPGERDDSEHPDDSAIRRLLALTGQITCNYSVANPAPQSRTDINSAHRSCAGREEYAGDAFSIRAERSEQRRCWRFGAAGRGLSIPAPRRRRLQVGDTQILSQRVINETRFEYQRETASQTALNTDADDPGVG